ncbi:MAG: wax ester/triacylglycerol synthase family O-acyltransferase [Acidimicrobiia bacterium]|nr:wax ester/triacylglycerol synthase family O-acyltransferase [Acidimicrobiia bacterium]
MSDTDAFTMQLERDPLLRSTVVAVVLLDHSPDWRILQDRVDRATRLSPTFREKLVRVPLQLAPPRWAIDTDFDLSWHLRRARVQAGGGVAAVLAFARKAGMSAFDAERPLWQITLLEDLPDGRAALVIKVHHALTDGIGGIQLAAHVVDFEREPAPRGPLPDLPTGHDRGPLDALTDAVTYNAHRMVDAARQLVGAIPRTIRHPVGTITETVTTAASISRFVRPVTSTRSPLMRARRLRWRYDILDVPLDDLRGAAHRRGGTLNDAFLAAITGGLRQYHQHHDTDVETLRLTMPVSVRGEGDPEGGNKVTLVRFEVPIGVVNPSERMELIGLRCRESRQERAIPFSNAIAAMLNLLPVTVTGGMLKHVDFLASNVPGFPDDVFVAGARVDAFYPFGPTLGSAVNVTLMSYGGDCNIGINTDVGAIPDPEVLLESIRRGFDEVLGNDD